MTEKEKLEDIRDGMRAWEEYRRRRAVKAIFKGEWNSDITDYKKAVRCFSVVKLFICLLLKRTGGSYLDNNMFCILSYNETSCIESYNWEAVWVSPKLFSGWQVCVGSDGT
jgi:hypothetical protein